MAVICLADEAERRQRREAKVARGRIVRVRIAEVHQQQIAADVEQTLAVDANRSRGIVEQQGAVIGVGNVRAAATNGSRRKPVHVDPVCPRGGSQEHEGAEHKQRPTERRHVPSLATSPCQRRYLTNHRQTLPVWLMALDLGTQV